MPDPTYTIQVLPVLPYKYQIKIPNSICSHLHLAVSFLSQGITEHAVGCQW